MKHLLQPYITCLMLLFPAALPLPAQPQSSPHPQAAAYPDIATYYSQLQRNTHAATTARWLHLCETTPVDTILLAAYSGKGMTLRGGTISTFDYFAYTRETLSATQRLAYVNELHDKVGHKYNSNHLELLVDFLKGFYMGRDSLSYEPKMKYYEQVIRKARKIGDVNMEALILREMYLGSFYSQRYVRTFAYSQRLEQALERAGDNYLYKSSDYFNIGMAYYMFKDYGRALPLFHKSLSDREASVEYDPDVTLKDWNYLAVYHQTNANLDSAAYYNRAILSSAEAREAEPIHLAIAISNLGRIEKERGNYTAATAMLEAGLDYVKDDRDISFMSGVRISLGECYLEKGEMQAAWQQITAARNVMGKLITIDRQKRLKALHALESSYYTRTGQHKRAKLYQDSALMTSSRYEQLTGQHFIVRGQQQLQEAEIKLKSQQITRQRNVIVSILAALVLASAGLILIIRLYRHRNAAYKALVQKAREWAMQDETTHRKYSTPASGDPKLPPTEEELDIMAHADREMVESHAYRETGITLDLLAARLNIRRNAVSGAINKVTGGNFNQYVNSYRIREAVRIISENRQNELHVDEIGERVGFGNRNTFGRTFKQFTGLSPVEFQRQREG